MPKRSWYHLTQTDHGSSFTMERRPPLLRLPSEPMTPRVCVSDRIAGCFAAILLDEGSTGYVYKYYGNTVKPIGIWDRGITRERWVIPPAKLTLHKVVPQLIVDEIYAATRLRLEISKKPASWRVRLAQYAIANKILCGKVPNYIVQFLNADPEEAILTI